MKDVSHSESFAFSARVLGALFYFAPDSEQAAPLVKALTAGEWVQDWPLPAETLQPVADTFASSSDEPLACGEVINSARFEEGRKIGESLILRAVEGLGPFCTAWRKMQIYE